MENTYFLHQIKRTNGIIEKGIVVKDSLDAVLQSYHAYLGAYAYGHDTNTDYVACMITGVFGNIIAPYNEYWIAPTQE